MAALGLVGGGNQRKVLLLKNLETISFKLINEGLFLFSALLPASWENLIPNTALKNLGSPFTYTGGKSEETL